jgi:hypothetical protein
MALSSLLAQQEAYQSAAANSFHIKKATCKNCIYFNRCDGIKKEYAFLIGTSEFKPIK